jgi:hypothetical protein
MRVRGLIERIEALEEGSTVDPSAQVIVTEFMRLLPDGVPRPELKYVERPSMPWLGLFRWSQGSQAATIMLQKYITGDEVTLRRIVAHEMCHHAAVMGGWMDAQKQGASVQMFVHQYQMGSGGDGHGKLFQQWADVFNSKYGADFVTKTSDAAMKKQEASHDILVLIRMKGTQLMWQRGQRLSARQQAYVAKVLGAGMGARFVTTRDTDLALGASIGTGKWSYSMDPTLNEKLMKAWDSGKPVDVASK